MANKSVFIDLPNFYSRLLSSGIGERKTIRDYFLNWLDLDLLASSLSTEINGIWVFYSGERLGPSSERIEGAYLKEYIHRINYLPGITARDVNIKGEQREPIKIVCDKCGAENVGESLSEKGVDSSLTVHLFDTMESWDTAYILSGDADYVPAVAALRRKGKFIIGVGFQDASSALVRECYQYINIIDDYIREDYLVYSLFVEKGFVDRWFLSEIASLPNNDVSSTIELIVRINQRGSRPLADKNDNELYYPYDLTLSCNGKINHVVRIELTKELQKEFPHKKIASSINPELFYIEIQGFPFYSIKTAFRRMGKVVKRLDIQDNSITTDFVIIKMTYLYDYEEKKYKMK